MKDREDIMEKIDGGNFPDDLLAQAEKATYELMRHSIIPLWKNTPVPRGHEKTWGQGYPRSQNGEEIKLPEHGRYRNPNGSP